MFLDTEDMQENVIKALKVIPQWEFQKCFQQWQHHWAKSIAAEVEYFEGKPYVYKYEACNEIIPGTS